MLCHPIEYYWNNTTPGGNYEGQNIACLLSGSTNLVLDPFTIALPMPILFGLLCVDQALHGVSRCLQACTRWRERQGRLALEPGRRHQLGTPNPSVRLRAGVCRSPVGRTWTRPATTKNADRLRLCAIPSASAGANGHSAALLSAPSDVRRSESQCRWR